MLRSAEEGMLALQGVRVSGVSDTTSRSTLSKISQTPNRWRYTLVKLGVSAIILAFIYVFESSIVSLLELLTEKELAGALFLLFLATTTVLCIYYAYRTYLDVTSHLIAKLSAKPSIRPAVHTILLFNKIFGLIISLVVILSLLSIKIPFLYVIVRSIMASFSGLFSILVALILALQVKEIVGNYLAGAIVKWSRIISDGEFLNMGDEYLKVENVNSAYTELVNRFGERIYVPNLKFLIENFRKPFSKTYRRYVDLRFSLPYKYHPDEIGGRIKKIVDMYNKSPSASSPPIDDYKLLALELASYSVVYELQARPLKPVFPETLKSSIRQLLHEEFGEDLATPTMVSVTR